MTISAQQLYVAYKDSVGGKGHDGWEMPDHVSGLGDRQQAGWQTAATFVNQHIGQALTEDRKVHAHNRLQQDLVDMAEQLAEKAATKIVDHFNKHVQHTIGVENKWSVDFGSIFDKAEETIAERVREQFKKHQE